MTAQHSKANEPSRHLSADRPILTRAQDRLGRHEFGEAIADAIRGWRGRDSLVLALCRSWGSGKSSPSNMSFLFAKGPGAKIIYSDDDKVQTLGERAGIRVSGVKDLQIPPEGLQIPLIPHEALPDAADG
jgi:hypothetical protein